MPKLGEIQKGTSIGKKQVDSYIWHSCIDCKEERWVRYSRKIGALHLKCGRCASVTRMGKQRRINIEGYIKIGLLPTDFFYRMANKRGYVYEHRLVIAKHLGRNLHQWEIVHHINGVKCDNRIENLQLVSDDRHNQITILENRIKQLEKRVMLLEAEITVLKSPIACKECR